MNSLLMTDELARRLRQADTDFTRCRMEQLRETSGNPYAADRRKFGRSEAFVARKLSMVPYFNKVVGRHDYCEKQLEKIVDFYDGVPFRFEILPSDLTYELAGLLGARGYYQTSFHTTLFGKPEAMRVSIERDGDIREVVSFEDLKVYVDVNLRAWGVARRFQEEVGSVMLTSYGHPSFKHYIGYTPHGTPVSVGTLHISEGVAYYGNAGTISDFRGRGYQALILQRIANDAREMDCDLVVGMARFGSSSHRNMERIGMRVGYTQAIWTQP